MPLVLLHALIALIGLLPLTARAQGQSPVHGLAMHGAPKYAPDFKHLDYVNPDAPKGGTLRLSALGTFDSLNPYIVKGVAADGTGLVMLTDTPTLTETDPAWQPAPVSPSD